MKDKTREKELLAKRSQLVKEADALGHIKKDSLARIDKIQKIRAIDQELHPTEDPYLIRPEIPLVDCKKGHLYRIQCRNLCLGVFDGNGGFIGIREKFGDHFLFTEFHYDTGAPYGTVDPREDLGPIPDHLIPQSSIGGHENKELFDWLSDRREKHIASLKERDKTLQTN